MIRAASRARPAQSEAGSGLDVTQVAVQPADAAWKPIRSRFVRDFSRVGVCADPLEEEADRVADRVSSASASPDVGRAPARIARASNRAKETSDVPMHVGQVLSGSGQSLEPDVRRQMEQRFSRDFSGVRVHHDAAADESARGINANAYTVGNDIVFAGGRFAPRTSTGRRLLAHELTHVIQQAHTGGSGPLAAGVLVQRDTPKGGTPPPPEAKKTERFPWIGRIRGTYSAALRRTPHKDPANPHAGTLADLPEGEFVEVIERTGGWLHVQARVGDKDVEGYVSQELVEFNRLDIDPTPDPKQSPVAGNDPKEGQQRAELPVAGDRLVTFSGFKVLAKGTMKWSGVLLPEHRPYKGETSAKIQISFTPNASYGSKTIMFEQTLLETVGTATDNPSEKPVIDIGDSNIPFYGPARSGYDSKSNKWIPDPAPPGYKNGPSTVTDPAAYLYDEPSVPPTEEKMFESVAVVPETTEELGALKWGVGGGNPRKLLGAEAKDCSDAPSAEFRGAVSRFYAPPSVGPNNSGRKKGTEFYDAILDGFPANAGVIAKATALTAAQKKQLDPLVERMKNDPNLVVEISGFADQNENDPSATSEARATAVWEYFKVNGVPPAKSSVGGFFGSAWARYAPGSNEKGNRRVQVRLKY